MRASEGFFMFRIVAMLSPLLFVLAACGVPAPPTPTTPAPAAPGSSRLSAAQTARTFTQVVQRMEPVVERECRAVTRNISCDFRIVVDDRPGQPANAFQTLDQNRRPLIVFTVPLIAQARNADEMAFVLGHEAAHHIEGHIERQQRDALAGAVIFGGLATLTGGDATTVQTAQDLGATVGARRYSKEYELEADRRGTILTMRAGFDPIVGAEFFNRIPDPGDRFLGTHPPNAQRIEVVRRTAAGG
jgi:predicted Zn-dependent protease